MLLWNTVKKLKTMADVIMIWWDIPWGELRLPLTNGGLISYIIALIIWHLGIIWIGFCFGWNWPWRKRR